MEFIGFIFIVILGSLSHFIYDWSGHNKFLAFFCAVNESTWEHIKLALGPAFLWLLIEIPFIGVNDNFIIAKFISILIMVLTIPLIFYSYSHILNKNYVVIDILIFVFAVFLGQFISDYILSLNSLPYYITYISLIGVIILFILYMTKTFLPDKNFLYKDPITKKYGIKAHYDEKKK